MARWQIPLVSNIGEIAVTAKATLPPSIASWLSKTISQPYIVVPNTDLVKIFAPYPFPLPQATVFESDTISQPIFPQQTQLLGALRGGIQNTRVGVTSPGYASWLKTTISQPSVLTVPTLQVFNPYPFPTPNIPPGYAAWLPNTISQPTLSQPNAQVFNPYPFPAPVTVTPPPSGYAAWLTTTIYEPSVLTIPTLQVFNPYPFPTPAAVTPPTGYAAWLTTTISQPYMAKVYPLQVFQPYAFPQPNTPNGYAAWVAKNISQPTPGPGYPNSLYNLGTNGALLLVTTTSTQAPQRRYMPYRTHRMR